jgi:hypothetical protein
VEIHLAESRPEALDTKMLTPHDLYDGDLQNSPVLTTARSHQVVIDGGKADTLIELNAQTGKLLWKLPVGVHTGHDDDGLLTEKRHPAARPARPQSPTTSCSPHLSR